MNMKGKDLLILMYSIVIGGMGLGICLIVLTGNPVYIIIMMIAGIMAGVVGAQYTKKTGKTPWNNEIWKGVISIMGLDTLKDIKTLWKQKNLEETYLASIANCDKRITRDKKNLLKANNDFSRKLLKGNIKMMEEMRLKWSNLLAEHRKELEQQNRRIDE